MPSIHLFGGGTFGHVRSHLAIAAPAFGGTARRLAALYREAGEDPILHLTRMADHESRLETNADVAARLEAVLDDPEARLVVFNAALCDFDGSIGDVPSGKHATRLKSREGAKEIAIVPADKVVGRARVRRPDLVVVGFKTTTRADVEEQFRRAAALRDEHALTFVLANDTVERRNLIVGPSARSLADCPPATADREAALRRLVEATLAAIRS